MTLSDKREPHHWSATETVEALAAGKIGAVELLNHYLARVARYNEAINAVVEIDVEGARRAAGEADARRLTGNSLPLDGLPMTIKDTYEVRGFRATAGIPDLTDHRPECDADSVARLRGSGAVIFGKTNVPIAASDHQSYNPIYGTTRNPWDLDRSPGGSSGGSAAALAAGFCALELGSDIGGSIRVPSHFCGVYGHKPTHGIVSSRGHVPPMPGELVPSPLSVTGPLARSAFDLSLALDRIAGPQGAAAKAWSLRLPPSRQNRLQDFRVAVWTGSYPVDEGYAARIHRFGDELEHAGVQVTRIAKMPRHLAETDALYLDMLFGVIGAAVSPAELKAYAEAAHGRQPDSYHARLGRATHQSYRDWAALASRQAQLTAAWDSWFNEWDVLICPVAMNVAFPHQVKDGHGPIAQLGRTLTVSGREEPYISNLLWPGIATLGQMPATVAPLADDVGGLPAGIQIMGARMDDLTTIRFAELSEQNFGGFIPPPAFR